MEADQTKTNLSPVSNALVATSGVSVGSGFGASAKDAFTSERGPSMRSFTPVSYCVPPWEWDLTPSELKPLSWYLTDRQVANIIYAVYDEEEIGQWRMFAKKVDEAYVYFHSPYGHVARELGYDNGDGLSAWLPSMKLTNDKEDNEELPMEQRLDERFDAIVLSSK